MSFAVEGKATLTKKLTRDDFLVGLLAALAKRGVIAISIRGREFYEAVECAFHSLEAVAGKFDVTPWFVIVLDPIHGDSPAIKESISSAVLRDIVSLDNPEYQDLRIKFGPTEADILLDNVPGGPELFDVLASTFIDAYPYVAV